MTFGLSFTREVQGKVLDFVLLKIKLYLNIFIYEIIKFQLFLKENVVFPHIQELAEAHRKKWYRTLGLKSHTGKLPRHSQWTLGIVHGMQRVQTGNPAQVHSTDRVFKLHHGDGEPKEHSYTFHFYEFI